MIDRKLVLRKLGQVAMHLIFWCAVLLFFTYLFGAGSKSYQDTLLFSLFLMPITIATTYVSIYKLIPDYLITKRYFLFGLYSLYTLVVSSYLIMLSIFFSLIYLANFEYDAMNPLTKNILLVTTVVYLFIFIVSAFKLLKLNIQQIEKTNVLERKFLETQLKLKEQELNYLKMQIHPHFLFNTLNTIYGFALKKADETPEMILKLSNLLDYLLYQADKPFVLLKEEVNHIKDYLALEKMRFHETLQVSISEENITGQQQIAPMLFIPFVENSFKHGQIKNGILNVSISVIVKNDTILFTIANSTNDNHKEEDGIGLANIKKRLELIYKSTYQLTIENEPESYKVNLSIPTKTPFKDA